jgi:hypothetical protein
MSFSAFDRYYIKLFEVNLDFLFFIVKKHLNFLSQTDLTRTGIISNSYNEMFEA